MKVLDKVSAHWMDDDGYWILLKDGWQDLYNPTSHTIHEDTKREAFVIAKDAIPCACRECHARSGVTA